MRTHFNRLKPALFFLLMPALLFSHFFFFSCKSTPDNVKNPLTPEEKKWLKEMDGEIRITDDPNWPPVAFQAKDEKGDFIERSRGISIDYIALIEKKLDFKFKRIYNIPWHQVIEKARNRDIDVVGAIRKNQDRSAFLDFTPPYIPTPYVIVVRKDAGYTTLSLETLKGKKVAVGKGFSIAAYLKDEYPEIILDDTNSTDFESLHKVIDSRATAAITDLAVVSHVIKTESITNLKIAGKADYNVPIRCASRNDWPILGRILAKGFAMITAEEKKTIADRWTTIDYPYSPLTRFSIYTLIAALLTTLFTLVWNKTLRLKVNQRTADLEKELENRKRIEENLRQSERKLKIAKDTAERASKTKNLFIANMSHEIRTPMNSILGFSELLDAHVEGEKAKYYLSVIKAGGNTLLNLISDILDLSKIEAGKVELNNREVNLFKTVAHIRHLFQWKMKEKGLDFKIEIDHDIPESLIMDETRLTQILLNLVGNAVKFTHAGYIKLSVQSRSASPPAADAVSLLFCVEDTGIGIDDTQKGKIFEPFTQTPTSISEETQGIGLGLSLSKRLVEIMGGDISLSSQLGKGSAFTIRFKRIQRGGHRVETHSSEPLDPRAVVFRPCTLLLAEDIKENRELIREFLAPYDITLIEAWTGMETLEAVQKHRPDLIIMDMKMPGLNGYEAARRIKSNPLSASIPIIAVSASVMKDSEDEVRQAGCDGFIRKPLRCARLIAQLARFLPYEKKELSPAPPTSGAQINAADIGALRALYRKNPEPFSRLTQRLEAEFLPDCHKLQKRMVKSKVEKFAHKIKKLGRLHQMALLEKWAVYLLNNAAEFNIENITDALREFPVLIDRFKEIIHKKGGNDASQ